MAASPTPQPATSHPDVIVVGSGIIGIACAHYLSATGLRVTVIDQGTIGGACSHGNCGYICPSHVLPLTEPGAIGTALKSLFNQGALKVVKRFGRGDGGLHRKPLAPALKVLRQDIERGRIAVHDVGFELSQGIEVRRQRRP